MICMFSVLALILSGCGKSGEKTDTNSAGENVQEVGEENTSDAAGSETADNSVDRGQGVTKPGNSVAEDNVPGDAGAMGITPIPYAYEQELNIISDNYRNYYEIFVYSYCDSNGDGIGDFNGIISKLDYINKELGFNGIWLMPIMPSKTYHKYDVLDYYSVDPQYGTLEDFQRLLEECERRDIKLIIDFVFNHTSASHSWFQAAERYLETLGEGQEPDPAECPYVEYYHFTRENNGGKNYHRVGTSNWYYEGVFWDQMPDLALESKAVRAEIEKIAKYWLDMGVDGFRLDAVKEFFTGAPSKNIEVLQWFEDYVSSMKADAYIVGEAWDEFSAIASYYISGVPSYFNFPLAQHNGIIVNTVRKLGTGSASSFAKSLLNMQEKYSAGNPDYIDAPFISNHDTTRISAMCVNDEQQMKMAAGLLLTLSGSPFVYYGEEIGMNSAGSKDENKRLPMQWSKTDTTGMTVGPDDADAVEQKFAPVDEQQGNSLSILNYYKRAIRIRNENPELARGTITMIEALTDKNICALEKNYQDSKIVVVSNINKEAAAVDLKAAGYDNLALRGYLTVDGSEITLTNGVLDLPLYSIAILKQ
jgi:alpha-amylase